MENPLDKWKTEIREHPTTLDVVTSLMNDDNIEMKTEITNPYALDVMMLFAQFFGKHGMKIIEELLEKWKELLLKYMVSNKRMSRSEIVEILKGYFAIEQQKNRDVKLGSNLAKINQQSTF